MLPSFQLSAQTIIATKCEAFRMGLYGRALDLIPKQEEAMRVLHGLHTSHSAVRELAYGGAAGGGKSYLGCEWLLWSCLAYPKTRWFVARYELKQIRESVAVTLKKVMSKHGIPDEDVRYNENEVYWRFANGSEIIGIETKQKNVDPDYARYGSAEFTGGWIEEAGYVPAKAYEVLKSRIGRHLNQQYGLKPKLLITCNPSRNWLYYDFYKPWKAGALSASKMFVQSFVDDNTKVDGEYVEQLDGLKGQLKARLRRGEWEYSDDPDQLIEYEAATELFSNSYLSPDFTKKALVTDPAMYGRDKFRWAVFAGGVMIEHGAMDKSGGADIVKVVKEAQARHSIRASQVIYDADGVGAFIGGTGGFIAGATAFHGNAAPIEMPDGGHRQYANLKAQCGWTLASKINGGEMWAKSVTDAEEMEILIEEMCQIKQVPGLANEKLRLLSKDKIKEVLGRSPDFSDLFLMYMLHELKALSKRPATGRKLAAI